MNIIKFKIEEETISHRGPCAGIETNYQWYGYKPIKILIDSNDLIDIIRDYESSFSIEETGDKRIAGNYSGLSSNKLYKQLNTINKKVCILNCVCGVEGCWPLIAKITIHENTVVWSNFHQPWRFNQKIKKFKNWDYSGFKDFIFDKKQYFDELETLEK